MRRVLLSLPLLLLTLTPVANAQTVSVSHTFTNGSVADADAMDANFEAVRTGLNAALTTTSVDPLMQFTNGTTADADEVNANFQALLDGVNTALSNRATDCGALGGSWSTAASTCTLGTPDYDCWRGGMCGVDSGFNYQGTPWEDETLTGTVCNDTAVGRARWNYGVSTAGPTAITPICLWGLADGKDCYRAGLCGSEGLNYTGSDYHGATQVGSGCDTGSDDASWNFGVMGAGYATDAAFICLTY